MEDPETALAEKEQSVQSFADSAEAVGSFLEFVHGAESDGALDNRTKELMSLSIGVALRCRDCIVWHLDGALEAGATPEEIDEALAIAVVMGGGPALMYATEARDVMQALVEE